MKASDRDMSDRYFQEKKQEIYDTFKAETEQVIKDREMMAGSRAQWILLVALARKGWGKKRFYDLFNEMNSMLPSLLEDRDADVMDEMLINDLERSGIDVRNTHVEYFEAKERLKLFGKFIDKKKERAEAEAKEKRLLASLRKHGFVFGIGAKNG